MFLLNALNCFFFQLDLTREEQENFTAMILSPENKQFRIRRSSCTDRTEEKIYNVVQYIPLIGELWGLGSAIGYAVKNCKEAAKTRGIDVAIGLAMDVATGATLGTGAAAFQGAKVAVKAGVKYGVKAGLKAGIKASGTAVKKLAVQSVKRGIKSLKNPVKAVIKDAKDTVHLLKNIPKTVKNTPKMLKQTAKGFKEYVDEVSELRKARKTIQRKIKNADVQEQKWKFDVHAPKTHQEEWYRSDIFPDSPASNAESLILCRRKRQVGTGSSCASDLFNKRTQGQIISELRETVFPKIENMLTTGDVKLTLPSGGEVTYPAAKKLDLVNTKIGKAEMKDLSNEFIFRSLQNYMEFAPSYGYRSKVYKAPLQVTMEIGGASRKFVLIDSTMGPFKKTQGQMLVATYDGDFPITTNTASTYNNFVKHLEGNDGLGKQRAKEILAAIKEHPSKQTGHKWSEIYVNRKKLFNEQQERTAVEFIAVTQIAENASPSLPKGAINKPNIDLPNVSKAGQKRPHFDSPNFQGQPNIPKDARKRPKIGRNPGTDKWARKLLRDIADEKSEMTWNKAFNNKKGTYVPAHKGGTQKTRELFQEEYSQQRQWSPEQIRSPKDLSSDSDDEMGGYIRHVRG